MPGENGHRRRDPPRREGEEPAARRYRTIWISDFHLGTRVSQAEHLLEFLKHTESDTLYLVGDIVDGWWLRRFWYWPQSHNDVVQKVLRKARKGTRVFYLPGNHDEAAKDFVGHSFGGVRIVERMVHVTADGRRLLVMHGDQFDHILPCARWLNLLGSGAYEVAIVVNQLFNVVRRKLGLPYWSLSAYLKHRVKDALSFMSDFEQTVTLEARRAHLDGLVCGHIHRAELRPINGFLYANDGDWVESCTALVEHRDGRLEIVRWMESRPAAAAGPGLEAESLSPAAPAALAGGRA